MAGINNSGGEYREYIWPVMLLFAIGLVLTLINFLSTIAKRKTKEIYISNWYMVAAVIFAIVIVLVAYLPFLGKRARQYNCTRLLHAPGGGYVVYAFYPGHCLLHASTTT